MEFMVSQSNVPIVFSHRTFLRHSIQMSRSHTKRRLTAASCLVIQHLLKANIVLRRCHFQDHSLMISCKWRQDSRAVRAYRGLTVMSMSDVYHFQMLVAWWPTFPHNERSWWAMGQRHFLLKLCHRDQLGCTVAQALHTADQAVLGVQCRKGRFI